MRHTIVIEPAGDNISAHGPAFRSCIATGPTIEKGEHESGAATELYLEDIKTEELPIPTATTGLDYIEVTA